MIAEESRFLEERSRSILATPRDRREA